MIDDQLTPAEIAELPCDEGSSRTWRERFPDCFELAELYGLDARELAVLLIKTRERVDRLLARNKKEKKCGF